MQSGLAQSYPPAWSSTASYAVGDQVQLNGNVLRAVRAASPGSFKYAYWELWDVRANTTILIGTGGQFPTLAGAWNYALNCRVAQGVYLHLFVLANHHEILTSPISLDHPFGANMTLIGADAASDIFSFDAVNGLNIDTGHVFGLVSNLTLQGSNAQGVPNITGGTYGVSVGSNAVLTTQKVSVSYFDYGIVGSNGGALFSGASGQADSISTFATVGILSTDHALVTIASPISLDGDINGNPTAGYGFHCVESGQMTANGCSAKNCTQSQFRAESGGFLIAQGASADGEGMASGFLTDFNGRIDARGSTVAHATFGYVCAHGSTIYAQNSTVTSPSSSYDYSAQDESLLEAESAQPGASYQTDNTSGVDVLGSKGSFIVQ